MSRPSSPTSWDNTPYYSAHRGPVFGVNGKFHHFQRRFNAAHLRSGHWRFPSETDEQRAYECGFSSPEAVLIAQDAGDGTEYSNIMLRWVPGEDDKSSKPSVGTAAAHLETIYNEKKLLNQSLAFRGQVPLYPVSTDQKLIDYRLVRYGIQKGVLPESTLLASSQSLSQHKTLSSSSQGNESHAISLADATHSITAHQSARQIPKADGVVTSPQVDPKEAATPRAPTHVRPRERQDVNQPEGFEHVKTIAKDQTGHEPARFLSNPEYSLSYESRCALLPCMDCRSIGSHTPDCWIDKATQVLKPADKLSTVELQSLVASVTQLDPGPWTMHFGPPPEEEEVGDAQIQIYDMAEAIRNLEESADDLDLYAFEAPVTVLLWAFKSCSDLQIIRRRVCPCGFRHHKLIILQRFNRLRCWTLEPEILGDS